MLDYRRSPLFSKEEKRTFVALDGNQKMMNMDDIFSWWFFFHGFHCHRGWQSLDAIFSLCGYFLWYSLGLARATDSVGCLREFSSWIDYTFTRDWRRVVSNRVPKLPAYLIVSKKWTLSLPDVNCVNPNTTRIDTINLETTYFSQIFPEHDTNWHD